MVYFWPLIHLNPALQFKVSNFVVQGKFNLLNIKKMRVIPLNSELCQKDQRLFLSEVVYLLFTSDRES